MATLINDLAKIIKRHNYSFVQLLDHIHCIDKYNDVTYRDIDKAFKLV